MKTSFPERVSVERGDRIIYNQLGTKLGKKFRHSDVFSLAMIYGYMNGIKVPLKRKEGLFRTISAKDNFYSLIILLYVNEMNQFPKNFDDFSLAFNIAQEYANGGLKLLESDVYKEMGNFSNKLASMILKFNYEHDFSDAFNKLGI